ncbi:hypothetical protein BAE44_0010437, partial [Dichanthelium oligosanthes]
LVVMVAMSKKMVRKVDVELELLNALKTIMLGHNNICVHLTNDKYKAMVGQLVCQWLDSLPGTDAYRRINSEVVLDVWRFISTTSRQRRLPMHQEDLVGV